ncbi:MAG: T9SS type A sorting domain-containing protein, partial [Chitinophagaceae bacterium]
SRTAAGTYTFTTTNSQGCDSVATLNLTVKTATTSTTNVSICPSELPYSWNGSRTAAGTYTFTTTNSQGCDSVATLNLTVKTATTSTINVSICPSQLPYSWNGLRNAAGTYTFTTTNSQGCDSVATLNLTVGSMTNSTTNVTNCGNYTWNGTTYSTSGTYNKLFTGLGGCDSIATLNLTVITSLPAIAGANNVCAGSTLSLSNAITGGVWYTQQTSQATINPSTGLVTAKSAGNIIVEYRKTGCTSAIKVITVNPIPAVPLIAYASGTNYTLFRYGGDFCKGKSFTVVGNPVGGSWNYTNPQVGTINSAGLVNLLGVGNGSIVYTVTDAKGCKNSRTTPGNVINCPIPKGANSNEQLTNSNDFVMYPNPTRSIINLNIDKLVGTGNIVVTDLYGKIVKTQALSIGTNTINVSNFVKGMYLVSVITNEEKITKKLVVE